MLALVFQAAGIACAIPCSRIVEVVPFLPFEPLPHREPAVRGLLVHRGRALPVLDVSKLVAGVFAEPRMSTRLVVVGRASAPSVPAAALMCPSVRGVRPVEGSPERDGISGSATIFEGTWLLDRQPLHGLAVDALVEIVIAPRMEGSAHASHRAAP